MTDDQQRAKEPESSCLQEMLQHMRQRGWIGADIESLILTAMALDTAALRAAPESVALRVAMTTLEQIATAPDDKGAKFNAASCVAFLTTQGAGGPEGFVVVPEVMDIDMEVAFCEAWFSKRRCIDDADMQDAWAAALAARPQGASDAS